MAGSISYLVGSEWGDLEWAPHLDSEQGRESYLKSLPPLVPREAGMPMKVPNENPVERLIRSPAPLTLKVS